MEVSKTKDFRMAYLINERKLRELESIIKDVSDEIEFNVSCIDGTSIKFTNLDDLINYPNRKEKQYKDIEVSNSFRSSLRISVRLYSIESRSITYRISGDERDVDYYAGKIEGFIRSLKQWYSFLGAMTPLTNTIGFAVLYVCVVSLFVLFHIIESTEWWISIIVALVVGIIYDKSRGYLFPTASFELGDGIDRVKRRSIVRNVIMGSILLAAVVSYFVNQIPSITGN